MYYDIFLINYLLISWQLSIYLSVSICKVLEINNLVPICTRIFKEKKILLKINYDIVISFPLKCANLLTEYNFTLKPYDIGSEGHIKLVSKVKYFFQ